MPFIPLLAVFAASFWSWPQQDPPIENGKTLEPVARSEAFEPYTETIRAARTVSFRMMPVPGGKFVMGSPKDEPGHRDEEGPGGTVEIEPFWMGRCEVTWEEYDCWNTDASLPQSKKPDGQSRPTPAYVDMTFGMGREGGYPAICMTNEAARQYCVWLSRKTGRFYRLPTEAEWEYACRAGTKTPWSFGADPSAAGDYAWCAANSGKKYHKVGQKKPNAFGLCDMHGNVSEWCADAWIADFYAPAVGGAYPRSSPYAVPRGKNGRPFRYPHVARGGSWQDPVEMLRSAARLRSDPSWKERDPQLPQSWWYFTDAPFVGFRVVRPLREPDAEQRALFENPR
ncbi:MAG: formylglycine-generating enzyme family protein [Planctomycetota bacterium]